MDRPGTAIDSRPDSPSHRQQCCRRERDAWRHLQLIVSGLANGCVYGLIALGFVLVYKAAEQVNFAQGDLMMLGAFVAVGLANEAYLGMPFWLACIGAVAAVAAVGWLLERAILRHVFGQSQLAVVILTIAIGFVLRFVAGAIWGHEPQVLESPLAGVHRTFGAVVLGVDEIAVVVVTLVLTGRPLRVLQPHQARRRHAGVEPEPARGVLHGHPREAHSRAGVGAGRRHRRGRGILFASKGSIDPNTGFLGIKAFAAAVIGGFGSLPGASGGRADRRAHRAARGPPRRGRVLADRPLRRHARWS